MHKDVIRDGKGNITGMSKQNVVTSHGTYHAVGKLSLDDTVECAMKFEGGQKVTFRGYVMRITKKTVGIKITTDVENNNVNSLISKIKKSWQE